MTSTKCLLILFLFRYCLGIPAGELGKILHLNYHSQYPSILQDPLEQDNRIIQWNMDGKVFLLHGNNAATYSEAMRTCEKYNMELVKIENEEKSRTVEAVLEMFTNDGDGPFWMSGNRLTDRETWTWTNDDPISYFNWAGKEPNNAKGDEMCIELYRDKAKWNDERCTIKNAFLCENIHKPQTGFQPILDSNDILYGEREHHTDPVESLDNGNSWNTDYSTPPPDDVIIHSKSNVDISRGNLKILSQLGNSKTSTDYEFEYDIEEATASLYSIEEPLNYYGSQVLTQSNEVLEEDLLAGTEDIEVNWNQRSDKDNYNSHNSRYHAYDKYEQEYARKEY